jgi:tight adherence protein B
VGAVLAAALAAAATACLLGLPSDAALRVRRAVRATAGPRLVPTVAGTAAEPRGIRTGRRAASRLRRRTWAVPAVAALLVVLVSDGARVVVPLALAAAGAVVLARLRRTRTLSAARRDERSRAVEACSGLAAELRAGRAPADALDAAAELASGPFRAALRAAAGAVRLGGDPAAALRPPPACAVPEVLRALAACWTVCAGSGGGLAAAVERLEEGLRAEQAQRRAVDAELAGPRATAGLLALLPAGGLLLAAGLGADPVSVLLTTPLGLLCLTVGLGLDGLGLWWTGRLVAAAGGRP